MKRKKLFKTILSVLEGHGVKKVAVFGSYARGDMSSKSDLDIIVQFLKEKVCLIS